MNKEYDAYFYSIMKFKRMELESQLMILKIDKVNKDTNQFLRRDFKSLYPMPKEPLIQYQ